MEKLSHERKANIFVLSSSLYISFQLFANILSTKIALLPYLNLAIDGGTVIYPLTFTLRDFVHKTHGKRDARQVIIIAAVLNAVMFGLFWLVGKMTPDPTWGYQEAYERILLPVGRIVLASIVAQVISELIDTEIFSVVYKKIGDTPAVFASNSISLVIDSFIFCFIAFLGVLPLATVMQIVVSNILVKFVISTLSVPTIKLIPRTAKFEDI
ncbi:MAG: queuosine precursor transporter [Patescibacteria group bacterium]|nr:queuosine precursor transporter [Patescibacteria group bacterium]